MIDNAGILGLFSHLVGDDGNIKEQYLVVGKSYQEDKWFFLTVKPDRYDNNNIGPVFKVCKSFVNSEFFFELLHRKSREHIIDDLKRAIKNDGLFYSATKQHTSADEKDRYEIDPNSICFVSVNFSLDLNALDAGTFDEEIICNALTKISPTEAKALGISHLKVSERLIKDAEDREFDDSIPF